MISFPLYQASFPVTIDCFSRHHAEWISSNICQCVTSFVCQVSVDVSRINLPKYRWKASISSSSSRLNGCISTPNCFASPASHMIGFNIRPTGRGMSSVSLCFKLVRYYLEPIFKPVQDIYARTVRKHSYINVIIYRQGAI